MRPAELIIVIVLIVIAVISSIGLLVAIAMLLTNAIETWRDQQKQLRRPR
ncbi:hypothetical protein [Hyphomicrobium sp. DY-1]